MSVLRWLLLASLAVALLVSSGTDARTSSTKPARGERPTEPTLDQQVAELVEAYRALPAVAQLDAEGARIVERLRLYTHPALKELSAQSREAIAQLRAYHKLRHLLRALQKNDLETVKNYADDPELLAVPLPSIAPARGKWEYKVLAESSVEKLGEGELAAGLGKLGEEGWELVSFEKGRFVFKRQK